MKFTLLLALLFATNAATLYAQVTFDFESLPIPASGSYQGDVSATGPERDLYTIESSAPSSFGSGTTFIQRLMVEENGETLSFSNTFENEFNSFTGFAISDVANQTATGFENQFAAFPGSGSGGSDNYLIGFSFDGNANLAASRLLNSIDVTNTTFAALGILGDDGTPTEDELPLEETNGFFELIIQGNNSAASLQQITVRLADYTENNDLLVDFWQTVDVSELQSTELTFSFAGSDVGGFGLNTPSYLALDNVTLAAVPEPSPIILVGIGIAGAMLRRRR